MARVFEPLATSQTPAAHIPVVTLDTVLTMANGAGNGCRCLSLTVVTAFREFANAGYLPLPSDQWVAMVDAAASASSPVSSNTFYRFAGLSPGSTGNCPNCRSECHAIFEQDGTRVVVDRWTIVATILLLADTEQLPRMTHQWHADLKRCFEASCEARTCDHCDCEREVEHA